MTDVSPFPTGYLTVQLYAGGSWVDVSADVGDDGVTIRCGRTAEGQDIDPSSASVRLRNPSGRYSPRNPRSDLYGLIGRNTPIRVGVTPPAGVLTWRFIGEVASWPNTWSRTGAPSSVVTLECAGVLRRLAQGAAPLHSPWYLGVKSLGANVIAYWPMEDAAGSTTIAAAVGSAKMNANGVTLAGYDGLKASDAVPTIGTGTLSATLPGVTFTGIQVRQLVRIPAGTPTDAVLLRLRMRSDSLARVDVIYSTGGALYTRHYDGDSTLVATGPTYGFGVDGANLLLSVELQQVSANVQVNVVIVQQGATSGLSGSATVTGVTLGKLTSIEVNPKGAALTDLAWGHISVEKSISSAFVLCAQLDGFEGETAAARISRLATSAGLTITTTTAGYSQPLGAQGTKSLVELMREAARADGGLLFEPRTTSDLAYVGGRALYWTTPTLTLTYTDNLVGIEPVDDDQATRNAVTVTRDGGSSATAVDTTSTLGTTAVGTYDDAVSLSLASDDQAQDQASWRVHLGTVDESRWPTISIDLANPAFLVSTVTTAALLGLSMGSTIRITSLPEWLPPEPITALIQGYTETIAPLHHKIAYASTPASPYRVARYSGTARYDGRGTVTASTLTATVGSASLTISAPTGVVWRHTTGDYDVMVGGERMTVTAVAGSVMTVTRGVNGVIRAHAAGEDLRLAEPTYLGL